jgi:hypothetical protein
MRAQFSRASTGVLVGASIGLALALNGCASKGASVHVGLDHPANPDAPVSAPLSRSRVLDLASADPIEPPRAQAPASGHQHGQPPSTTQPPATTQPASAAHGASHEHHPPAQTTPAEQSAAVFVCPMHPEVTSDKPDDRCPKCGMKLVPKEDRR